MVVAGRHEDDRLGVRRLQHAGDVRGDDRPPRERAEVDGLEVGERACSRPRSSSPSRTARCGRPRRARGRSASSQWSAQSLRTAIASSIPPSTESCFWKTCMTHPRVAAVGEQRGARVVEVRVRVVALPHLLDGQVEDLGREPLYARRRWSRAIVVRRRGSRAPGRRRARPGRPRAAAASARRSRSGAGTRGRARRATRATGWSGWRAIQPKISVAAATLRAAAAARAGPRSAPAPSRRARRRPRGRAAAARPGASRTARAPSRAGSPCSYVPIEMCSAPW